MLRNYFLIAVRNLKNTFAYSFINIIGLSIGIACCLVIGLFVVDQYSYDTYHEKADHIYRVVNRQVEGTGSMYVAVTQGLLAPELKKQFPEVEAATRVGFLRKNISRENSEPSEDRVMAIDTSFFSIFDIPFIAKAEPLTEKGIYISNEAAERYFGKENPIGRTLIVSDIGSLRVSGVYQTFPYQSHLQAELMISFSWIEKSESLALSWASNSYYNYVLMPEHLDKNAFDKKLNTFIHQFTPPSWKKFEYFLQPLLDVHLQAGYVANPSGSIGRVLVLGFMAVGIIILLLATLNYMNLATARSARRAMEVGVRKAMGAFRSQLVFQFLAESFVLCLLSFLLAILWADLAIPFFNAATGWKLNIINFIKSPLMLGGVITSFFLLTIIAGTYPAFFLSRYAPKAVLKGQKNKDSSRRLRKALVVVQFTFTSALVIILIVVFKQTDYLRSRDLGFNQEQLLLFGGDRNKDIGIEAFKGELMKVPGVKSVTVATNFPGDRVSTTDLYKANETAEESLKIQWIFTDHDYIPTLDLRLLAGRNFLANGRDENTGVIINENAASAFGWTPQEAIGQKVAGFIFNDSLPGEVIGVIKDFHIAALRKEIMPLVIGYAADNTGYMVRLDAKDVFHVREQVDRVNLQHMQRKTYQSMFMEESIEETYAGEKRTGEFLVIFTVLALVIGCLGLYALSAYEGEQRIKELGIRKIMGANAFELLMLMSKSFLKLIVISLIVAMPLSYWVANIWLRMFPYRISWSPVIFLQAAFWIILLGWATILSQGIKASRLDPVKALRYE